MSEIDRLLAEKKRFAKQWKIVGWTLGMAFVVWLITNGKEGGLRGTHSDWSVSRVRTWLLVHAQMKGDSAIQLIQLVSNGEMVSNAKANAAE
jgi:hypothetical protein